VVIRRESATELAAIGFAVFFISSKALHFDGYDGDGHGAISSRWPSLLVQRHNLNFDNKSTIAVTLFPSKEIHQTRFRLDAREYGG
jgi:hypothetical protein